MKATSANKWPLNAAEARNGTSYPVDKAAGFNNLIELYGQRAVVQPALAPRQSHPGMAAAMAKICSRTPSKHGA